MPRGRVTERTFYDALMGVIREAGGTGVQEVSYNSVPDIIFRMDSTRWLMSVKIGQDLRTVKDAFVQYLRHKEESRIRFGILLLLPESLRQTRATEKAVRAAIRETKPAALIDAGLVKEEIRDRSFPGIVDFLKKIVLARLARREPSYYSLSLVISLLQQQVSELMADISLEETSLLCIITDRNLLMHLGDLKKENQLQDATRFLASYILLSQILFLRLLASGRPGFLTRPLSPVTPHTLRATFARILEINYRPIYAIDVLDSIPLKFLRDTFDLIWGLEVERVRYELPGRIFHELMPSRIRKMLAAFYTRPQAADLLAHLTIERSDQTVLDPACGSGTILTSAYRRKKELFREEGRAGNPHRRFSEEEIFGADIMPFAVHLTSANLAAMDPATTIERTQIIQGDSLDLVSGTVYESGLQALDLFPTTGTARTAAGDAYQVQLGRADVILMNPPFTKVERGIANLINMERLSDRVGGEVGLWGHFIAFADLFLQPKGTYGAVLPINVLRGRESSRVRKILFDEWTPLYVLKPTRNYGFSEGAEYRDVLFVARRQKPDPEHRVKFCLIKKDLTRLTDENVATIADRIRTKDSLCGDELVDINSHKLLEVKERFVNLMWYCGVTDFSHRDTIVDFLNRFSGKLLGFPDGYFREGFRPVPKGVSKLLFLTRRCEGSRSRQAFLTFSEENPSYITAQSPLDVSHVVERECLMPTLRTSVGMSTMDISDSCDYIAYRPYEEVARVCRAANQELPGASFWTRVQRELKSVETNIVVSHRINPFSPSVCLNAFFSDALLSPSNQVNVIMERDHERGQALCVLLNSVIFFANFFLLKEESTGRYINIRFYDLGEMKLYPSKESLPALVRIFGEYSRRHFPSLRHQFDEDFDDRYREFREKDTGQMRLISISKEAVRPFPDRLAFDLEVCRTLGVAITKDDLLRLYHVFVNEMMAIRALTRD